MTLFRRLILSLALLAGIVPALAQVPAPVPALPDSERRTSYSISGTTCACNVNFALYGDSTDYQNWVEVYLNGVNVAFNDPTFGWAITSPSGSLASIARPVTNAVLTFTNAQTGTVQIVGAQRPRRTAQFAENAGVSARNLNQAFTGIIATQREVWDKTNDVTGRALLSQPGNTMGLLPLPAACSGKYLGFDVTGMIPTCLGGSPGSGNVTGPASSTIGHSALWANTAGTLLSDGGQARTTLSGPTTYFVRASAGASADTNCSGLTNVDDPGTGTIPRACAFVTPQKSDTAVHALDTNLQAVTIDMTGVFTSGIACSAPFVGGGSVTVTSSAGATINVTNGNGIVPSNGCVLSVTGTIAFSTISSGIALLAGPGGYLSANVTNFTIGPTATGQFQAGWNGPAGSIGNGGGTIDITGTGYTTTGANGFFVHSPTGNSFIRFPSAAFTVVRSGTTSCVNFCIGVTAGEISALGVTWPAGVTGPQYLIHNNGTFIGDPALLPGSVTGTTAGGAAYAVSDTNNETSAARISIGAALPADSPLTVNGNTAATVAPPVGTQAHIVGADNVNNFVVLDSFDNGAVASSFVIGRKANGTLGAKTAVVATNPLIDFDGFGWDTTGYFFGAGMRPRSTETWSATAHGGEVALRTVLNGTTTVSDVLVARNTGGATLNRTANPPAGVFDVGTGFQIGGAAASNHALCGNGTNYIDCATLPLSILSGLGTGVATFLATPSSANLAAAITDEVGTGNAVFASTGTWTPTDQSGAALTFTSVNCKYQIIGNMVHAYGTFTFPSTANGATVLIGGLPAAVPNASYAVVPSAIKNTSGVNGPVAVPVINSSNFNIFLNGTAANAVNSLFTTSVITVNITYPAI